MGACAIGDVSEDLRPVLELNPIDTVGKGLYDDPLHEWGALGHEPRLYQTAAIAPHPCRERGLVVSTTGPFSVIATVCSK
jgi:hypothetical protein